MNTSKLALIASVAAGVIVAFLASNIIALDAVWSHGIQVGLTILAAWGISPLTGPAFRAWLHLTNGAAVAIGGALAAVQIVQVEAVGLSTTWHGILGGVIAFAAGLGFAPSTAGSVGSSVKS